jgi:hypothetical protein
MRRILKLPQFIAIEYKKHQDSIVDKSSFRNTVVWRSAASRGDWSDAGADKKQYHAHPQNDEGGSHHRSPRTNGPGDHRSPRPHQHGGGAGSAQAAGGAWKTHRYDKDGNKTETSPRESKFNTPSQSSMASTWSKAAANATASAGGERPNSGWHRAGGDISEGVDKRRDAATGNLEE